LSAWQHYAEEKQKQANKAHFYAVLGTRRNKPDACSGRQKPFSEPYAGEGLFVPSG